MPSTAIPAVKAAVLEILKEVEALKSAKVVITADKEPERAREYIWLWKATATREFKSLGPQPSALNEEVKIFLRVMVVKGDSSPTPSEERAFEILEEMETALRGQVRLNGAVRFQHVEDLEQEQLIFDRKRGCHILVTLTAKARI